MRTLIILVLALLTTSILVACGGGTDVPTPTPTEAAATATSEEHAEEEDEHDEEADLESEGREVYLEVGCASCHGENAEGSALAPALAGHTAEQVERQVRNPVGMMPSFDDEQLNEDDLIALVAYIDSLEGEHGHSFEEGAPESTHFLMALIALKDNNFDEAIHHVSHAQEFVHDVDLEKQMDELMQLLEAEDMHDAEHMLEGMIEEVSDPDEATLAELHLQVTLQAIRNEDVDDARHHIEHYLDFATGSDAEVANEVIVLLASGDLHEAEDLINTLLGIDEHDE